MPLDGSAGHGDATAVKQEHFRTILGTHMAAARAIIAKSKRDGWRHHPKYVYFDLNAGPGIVGGHVGSPLIFLRTATELGIPFEAHFFEQDPASVAALQINVAALQSELGPFPGTAFCWKGDCNEMVEVAIRRLETKTDRTFGLAYTDPNGHKVPVMAMKAIAQHPRLRKLDFLVHASGAAYKRVRGRGYTTAELSNDIRQVGKKLILIRDPIGIWQWTFVLLSNWVDMPRFKRIGFHEADSPDGEDVERRINEPSPKGPRPMRPTPSTFGIPSSSPSAPSSLSALGAGASGVGSTARPNLTICDTRPGERSTYPRT